MQFILHMAMTPRGHVVLDPGRDGRRFVWQIGFIIRLLNERLAHRIPRAWCHAAIGSYLSGSSPRSLGVGAMVLIPLRLEFCRRATAYPKPFPLSGRISLDFTISQTDAAASRRSHGE